VETGAFYEGQLKLLQGTFSMKYLMEVVNSWQKCCFVFGEHT